MRRILSVMTLTLVATLCHAQSVGTIAKITVIDRDSGVALVPHLYRGEYWVAGVPGARYAIEVRNRLGERLLAVASVDGVNVISGETASWDQVGYVFSPGERYQISGWRKSDTDVAAFTFTSLPNSYAARTGRPANIGVIGVAMFREQPPQLSVAPRERLSDDSIGGAGMRRDLPAAPETPRADNAPVARAADAAASAEPRVTAQAAPMMRAPASAIPEAKLGTGHGEREYSYVSHTEFQRLQPQPNELIRIHYDSLENLVAMGIIRRPPPAWPGPPTGNPFPGSPDAQYVPDPPG
jgi:hypothetical protein